MTSVAGIWLGPEFEWQKDGVCAKHPEPDDFFPHKRPGRAATAQCDDCPVRERCLEHALAWGESGVWGGTTEKERRLMGRSG